MSLLNKHENYILTKNFCKICLGKENEYIIIVYFFLEIQFPWWSELIIFKLVLLGLVQMWINFYFQ